MRKLRATIMLVLSLITGLGATLMAAAWVQQKGETPAHPVAIAAVDIDLGSRIEPQMIRLIAWPGDSTPPGSFASIEALADRVARTAILRGEAILEGKLAPQGSRGGLSAVIQAGHRAMTVRVNDVIGVAGFALPGNYVDIVVNTQQDGVGADARPISKIVLEHILVLAVAQEANRDETRPKVVSAVTLEVSPADAEKLDLARSVGTLSLVLRNQVDTQAAETAGMTKRQLLVGEAPPVPPPARPARAARPAPAPLAAARTECVEVIKGGSRRMECF